MLLILRNNELILYFCIFLDNIIVIVIRYCLLVLVEVFLFISNFELVV